MDIINERTQDEIKGVRFRTAAELSNAISAEVVFVSEPYVVAGAMAEISGKIKASGKTTFLLAMCRSVLDGQQFMGYPTIKSPIVYLTEQPDASFRVAISAFCANLLRVYDHKLGDCVSKRSRKQDEPWRT